MVNQLPAYCASGGGGSRVSHFTQTYAGSEPFRPWTEEPCYCPGALVLCNGAVYVAVNRTKPGDSAPHSQHPDWRQVVTIQLYVESSEADKKNPLQGYEVEPTN